MQKEKCYKKIFDLPKWESGASMCWGTFGTKSCEFLCSCIEQSRKRLGNTKYKNLMKKARLMSRLK